MNTVNTVNKRIIVLILLIVVALGATGLFILTKKQEKVEPPQQPLVSVDKKKVEKIRQEIAWSSTRKTGDWPIYSTNGFKIEYASRAMIFFVTVLQTPFEVNKKAAEDWFVKHNLNSRELCEMRIVFIASEGVKKDLAREDIAPNGCEPVTNFFPQATGSAQ